MSTPWIRGLHSRNGRTYNFNEIHLADPCREMKPLRDTSQLVSHILTISCLRSVEDEGSSIMSLTIYILCHVVCFAMKRWMNPITGIMNEIMDKKH